MQNHKLYKKLKQMAGNYTVKQAADLPTEQIRSLLKIDGKITETFIRNMRNVIVSELQNKQDIIDEKRIADVLDSGFPKWRATEKGKEMLRVFNG